ncbi:uncharacterized protein PAM68-like [Phoenix dactylifera]|uniref:Uncharacterized protein PAM68-like n=1 Tax=Phoenix dactylifera TaxID=42345 RepID=A0A8B7CT96_PHODC|nr:uncharacterized protein PAM68-like [Phoenix dactylifera]
METLLHQVALPSPPHITRASSWMNRSPVPIRPTSPVHTLLSKKRAKESQAQGRGFGITVSDKNRRLEKADINNNAPNDGDDEIPPDVFDRMIRRMLFSVGTPMALGIGLLYVLSLLKKGNLWEVPGWLPFLTILLSFGTSAMGIAYATLTTSWDHNKEGSLLGWEEAKKNWPELWKEEDDKR